MLVAAQQKKVSWTGLSADAALLKNYHYVFVTIVVDVAAGDCLDDGFRRC